MTTLLNKVLRTKNVQMHGYVLDGYPKVIYLEKENWDLEKKIYFHLRSKRDFFLSLFI
jgi:hypothetical protein